ncbi:MAG: hypothetical protein R3F34_11110 [Planctomycetota bacterium]
MPTTFGRAETVEFGEAAAPSLNLHWPRLAEDFAKAVEAAGLRGTEATASRATPARECSSRLALVDEGCSGCGGPTPTG